MIDRVLNFGPVQQDSYYFQLIPISLSIVNSECELPASGTTYKFTVSKGQQKFDQNKIPIEANFQVVNQKPVMVINTCRLNFYIPNYSKLRKQDFSFTLVQREHNQDYGLGQFKVAVDDLITQFKEENKVRFEFKANFSEDYELEFQVYVEKNRMALEKNIRENKTERINKSPLRSRKEERVESPRKVFSPKQDKREKIVTPSRDVQEPVPKQQPVTPSQDKVERKEVEEKIQTPEPQVAQRPRSPPQSEKAAVIPAKSEKSEKNDVQSRRTGQQVPLVTTKFKQVSRLDTPGEVNLENSVRLSQSAGQSASKSSEGGDLKEKLFMWAFLIVSAGIMYLSMHPNRRV